MSLFFKFRSFTASARAERSRRSLLVAPAAEGAPAQVSTPATRNRDRALSPLVGRASKWILPNNTVPFGGSTEGQPGGGVRHGVRRGAGERVPRAARALARQGRPARQLQRQGRGEGAPREVPHGQVRQPPDGADPQAARRRDVALRRAAEAVRAARGGGGRGGRRGGGGHRRAAGHGLRRAAPRPPRETAAGRQETVAGCEQIHQRITRKG